MPYIMNALDEEQTTVVFGKYFTFKPRQIKLFQDNVAQFISMYRKDQGFVDVPEAVEDASYKDSPEGKAAIEAKRKEGIENHVRYLRSIIYNMQVSLKKNLDQANIKVDPRVEASDGEFLALEKLAKYQTQKSDEDQKRIDRIKELEKSIKA